MSERVNDAHFAIEENRVTVISPRVVLSQNGIVTLVPYKGTRLHGLPGGMLQENELKGNLLTVGSFPGLTREVQEECGVDIGARLQNAVLLGLAEVSTVNNEKQTCKDYLSPIFYLDIGDHPQLCHDLHSNPKLYHLDTRSRENPIPLLPDASIAVNMIRKRHKAGGFLMKGMKRLYYQVSPTPGLLLQAPSWLTHT